jgi:ADP-ribose pyrophosphatase YjhB (NUDIX family)
VEVRVKVSSDREYPTRPFVGVGGIVISGGRALLVRRSGPPLKDRWSIPGGMLETGETLAEGVQREIAEETAIEVRVLNLVDVFERIERDAEGSAQYHFIVLDYLCEVLRGEARAGSDVSDVAWASPDELGKYSLTEVTTGVILKAFAITRGDDAGLPADEGI